MSVNDVLFLAKAPLPASVNCWHPYEFMSANDVLFLDKASMPASVTQIKVEAATRHTQPGARLHIVTDCLTVVQGWSASVWRRDDYRNLAAGLWRLMGQQAPAQVSKIKAHLSKDRAVAVGVMRGMEERQ